MGFVKKISYLYHIVFFYWNSLIHWRIVTGPNDLTPLYSVLELKLKKKHSMFLSGLETIHTAYWGAIGPSAIGCFK